MSTTSHMEWCESNSHGMCNCRLGQVPVRSEEASGEKAKFDYTKWNQMSRGIAMIAAGLSDDALEVLLQVAKRLAVGQKEYGMLDLDNPKHDFMQERHEEALDYMIYSVMHFVREGRR